MLYIHASNYLENLSHALAEVVKQPLARPLDAEIIVIQHLSIKHWLSLQLAEKLGIWANCHFPFLHNLLRKVFKATLNTQIVDPFTQEMMEWTIMKILPYYLELNEFAAIKTYLQDDQQGLKRFQLASRIANLFDNYMIFRSEEIRTWQSGQQPTSWQQNITADWQKILWQALQQEYATQHRTELQFTLLQRFQEKTLTSEKLKFLLHQEGIQRLSIFGISALSPFYLNVFDVLSHAIDVHIFIVNPCQEYWADIVSEAEQARRIRHANRIKIPPELLHFDVGNNLLASLGKFGRDFIDIVYSHFDYSQTTEHFSDPHRKNLLHCIQQDILLLRQAPIDYPKPIIAQNDTSIRIHVCHSPMREIEVLHDQLLALFEQNPQLQPKDIVVAMPEVENYAPFIEAVFATTAEESKRIPFTIADCGLRHQNVLIDAFLAILELKDSRFTSNEVMKILEFEVVQQHFELTDADLQLIRHWIYQTGIRWGMDKNSHVDLQLADFEQNTWQHGLNRLLLGYALPRVPLHDMQHEEQLFANILPFDEIEGKDTLILGKLIKFVQSLFNITQYMAKNHTLLEWRTFLLTVLDDFLQVDQETEEQLQKINQVLNQLVDCQKIAKLTETINSVVIINYLQRYLEKEPQNSPFLTGQVTFCNILSLNSIPFKVVYLIGMNEQVFPRPYKPLSFDLITQYPRITDRSPRENDRYVFLASLLAAREYFYLSYVGRSIRDNSEISPSVLVSELIDHINKSFEHETQMREKEAKLLESKKNTCDYLITLHPLQAFSYRYFSQQTEDTHLTSYANEYCRAYTATQHTQLSTFLMAPLPEPTPHVEWQIVELDRLIRFFIHPAEFFLRHRLGIILTQQKDFLEDNEPFILTGLEKYQLTQEMVEKGLNGQDLTHYYTIVKASGKLPFGHIGEQLYQQEQEQIQQFIQQVQQYIPPNETFTSVPFQLTLGSMTLIGHLKPMYPQGLVHYRYTSLKPKDHLKTWLYHLVFNAISPNHSTGRSILIGRSDSLSTKTKDWAIWHYRTMTQLQSREILEQLLQLYWQGLQQPLYFFPKAALEFASNIVQKQKSSEDALRSALKVWQGSNDKTFGQRGEKEDAYYQRCFGEIEDNELLGKSFQTIALTIFSPLLQAIQ